MPAAPDDSPAPSDAAAFASWCRRLAAGDAAAFEELFRATHASLVHYAVTFTRDRPAARDLVQDAYVRIWERRAGLDPQRSLKALLFRTVRNLALNHARDHHTRRHLLDGYDPGLYREHAPDEHTAGADLGRRLDAWIGELPGRQREALVLSRFDGLSHDEIAEVMEVSPRTVNNHLVKALRHLRERTRAYEPTLLP